MPHFHQRAFTNKNLQLPFHIVHEPVSLLHVNSEDSRVVSLAKIQRVSVIAQAQAEGGDVGDGEQIFLVTLVLTKHFFISHTHRAGITQCELEMSEL